MTAAEQIFLTEPQTAPEDSFAPEAKTPHLRLVEVSLQPIEDPRTQEIGEATHAVVMTQARLSRATKELQKIWQKEPYKTKPNGDTVPLVVYALRRAYYEFRRKPAAAYREKTLAAQAAARAALYDVTAGDGEAGWYRSPAII